MSLVVAMSPFSPEVVADGWEKEYGQAGPENTDRQDGHLHARASKPKGNGNQNNGQEYRERVAGFHNAIQP